MFCQNSDISPLLEFRWIFAKVFSRLAPALKLVEKFFPGVSGKGEKHGAQ
jgi:hypothetical protein